MARRPSTSTFQVTPPGGEPGGTGIGGRVPRQLSGPAAWVALAVAAVIVAAPCVTLLAVLYERHLVRSRTTFVLPSDYSGPFYVQFRRPHGSSARVGLGRYEFRVPAGGALAVREPSPFAEFQASITARRADGTPVPVVSETAGPPSPPATGPASRPAGRVCLWLFVGEVPDDRDGDLAFFVGTREELHRYRDAARGLKR